MQSRRPHPIIVCFTPFGDDWTWFLQELTAPTVRWKFLSDLPTRWWHRFLLNPNLITPVVALRTVLLASRKKATLIITHDPRATAWVGMWCGLFSVNIEHMSFSFNFPEMPSGFKKKLFRYGLKHVNLCRVHSRMEVQFYSDYFGIPVERIRLGLWCMNMPQVAPPEPLAAGDYLCAVGGNARDYETLLAASRLASEIPMVWVVRPYNVAGLDMPAHIRVITNVPYPAAMNYLAHSRAMVLPLQSAEVPCGHVTLVSAMFLKKAIVVTESTGISDYVKEGVNGLVCQTGDAADLARCMRILWNDHDLADRMGQAGHAFAEECCTEAVVRDEMSRYFDRLGLGLSRPQPELSLDTRAQATADHVTS